MERKFGRQGSQGWDGAVKAGDEPQGGEAANADRRRKSDVTRGRILDAAAVLFGDQGYSATTMRQIAKRARIDAGTVYYYFASKEEILDEVLRIGIAAVGEAVESAVEDLPAATSHRDRIRVATEAHLNTLLKYSVYTSANIAIFGQVSPEARNRNRVLRRRYADYWAGLLKAAQDAGEISPAADLTLLRLLLLGSINWSLQWYDPKKKPIGELAGAFCAMVFDGVGTTPDGDRRPRISTA